MEDTSLDESRVEEEEGGSQPQRGKKNTGGAGLEEALGLDRQGGGGGDWRFDPAKELLKGSLLPEEYIPRSNYTHEMIIFRCLELGELHRCTYGYTDTGVMNWNEDHMRQALNGKRVQDVVKILIGNTHRREEAQRPAFENVSGINMRNPELK